MKDWIDTEGEGVKVFVLDSGINKGAPVNVHAARSFVEPATDDYNGHGTAMACIIAANSPVHMGVAPKCLLHIAKITGKYTDWKAIIRALDWAIDSQAQVLSMSFSMICHRREIRDRLEILDASGCICVAAYCQWQKYPHIYPSVLSAGSLQGHRGLNVSTFERWFRNAPATMGGGLRGTSVATAITAGVAACAKAKSPAIDRALFLAGCE
jgi:subtilisin family serine protease